MAIGLGEEASGNIAQALDATAVPKVTGPVVGGEHGHPFTAYVEDLAALGYVEEEFFLEGIATRYQPVGEFGPDGKWTVSPSGTAPYKTRMIVRRPRDPAHFNGTVLLEWLNVTGGYDVGLVGSVSDGIYRNGFAYVGVSCQRVGIEGYSSLPQGLKAWDPERYGDLSIPGDSISYDILSQAGRALGPARPRGEVDPLNGLSVKSIIAIGGSQSAACLKTYMNAIHGQDRVFDGFLPFIDMGLAYGFVDSAPASAAELSSPDRVRIRARVRDDLDVPVFIVNSETETVIFYPSRQPDTDRFRFWEVAGASHVPTGMEDYSAKLQKRDGIVSLDETPPGSKVPWQPSCDAAISHLANWIAEGTEPPKAERIEVQLGDMPDVVRDSFGNAVGGLRLPEVEVPVASYRAALVGLNGINGLKGETAPFSADELSRLYPAREDYVRRVTEAARASAAAGFIEPARVDEYIAIAATEPLGNAANLAATHP